MELVVRNSREEKLGWPIVFVHYDIYSLAALNLFEEIHVFFDHLASRSMCFV